MANKRDDFSDKTIRTLRERVSGICSKPGCRTRTTAAHTTDDEKILNVGKAAHICAAASGGPRYDSNMSTQKRKSINNGIWLCGIHADEIDKDDEEIYSIEILHQWKKDAEEESRNELGERLPHKDDAVHTLTTALTGHPIKALPHAINNIFKANNSILENLDPRFSVLSSFDGNKTTINLHAKEPVSVTMKIDSSSTKEFKSSYDGLKAHGTDIEISSSAISFEGSDLLERLFKESDTLKISKQKFNITQKIWLTNKETNEILPFDDLHGSMSIGTESFTFKGEACDGFLTFNLSKPHHNDSGKFTLFVNTEKWIGSDIRHLPYFEKLRSLFKNIYKGWPLSSFLEYKGEKFIETKNINTASSEYVLDMNNFFSYIYLSRVVANELKVSVPFKENIEFSAEDHENLARIVHIFEGKNKYSLNNIKTNPTCDLIVCGKNIDLLNQGKQEPLAILFTQEEGKEIKLFEQSVKIPPLNVSFEDVLPSISNPKNKYQEGDLVKIEWIPQENFKGNSFYVGHEKTQSPQQT